jgi:type IV pilus assembly protein PilA
MIRLGPGFTFVEVLILIAIAGIIAVASIPAYMGYHRNARVAEALQEAYALRKALDEFHMKHKRLPSKAEALQFRRDPAALKTARSVVYNPDDRMIVITMRDYAYDGKSFALRAESREGVVTWSCRSVDIENKWLPASCR